MAPFRVRRRGATRRYYSAQTHTTRSPPHGEDRKRGLSSGRLTAPVTIGRANCGVRREPRTRPAIPIGRIEIDAQAIYGGTRTATKFAFTRRRNDAGSRMRGLGVKALS